MGIEILAVDTWAVAALRYSTGVIELSDEFREFVDRKTRKIMSLQGALHPKSDVGRLYLSRQR